MKNIFLILSLLTVFNSNISYATGKIQNEDVKSLSDITSAVLTTTGNLTISNACISSPGSTANLGVGQFIYDTTHSTFIPAGTTIVGLPGSCSAGQIQMSQNATTSATGDTLTFGGQKSQLINDSKMYVTGASLNDQFSTLLTNNNIVNTGSSTAVTLPASFTLSALSASLPVQTNGSKQLTSAAIDLSGTQATGTLAAGRFPALTSDVTTTAGSVATTVAKIQGTTVSGTTGTSNVVFSASPQFSGNVGMGTAGLSGVPLTVTGGNLAVTGVNAFINYGVGQPGASNAEYVFLQHGGASSGAEIAVQSSGTGVNRPLHILMGASIVDTFDTNGYLAVGTTSNPVAVLQASGNSANSGIFLNSSALGTSSAAVGANIGPTFSSSVTSSAQGVYVDVGTTAASYTLSNAYGVYIDNPSKGAGSTITNDYGLYINTQSQGGSNNYAIFTNSGKVSLGDQLIANGTNNFFNKSSTTSGFGGGIEAANSSAHFSGILSDSGGRILRLATSDYNDSTNTGSILSMTAGAGTGNTTMNLQAFNSGSSTASILALNPSGGNVGIGTVGPGSLLEVNGTVKIDGNAVITNNSTLQFDNNANILWKNSSGTARNIITLNGSNNVFITGADSSGASTGGVTLAYSNGNIGLNLKGDGTIFLPGIGTQSGAVDYLCWNASNGQIFGETGTCTTSSRKFKKNIQDLNTGLKGVLAMRPVSFDYKDEYNPEKLGSQVGFIAEDIEKIDRRLATYDHKTGVLKSVNYQQITAVLAKAIQEQEGEIQYLKKEIHHLQDKLKGH